MEPETINEDVDGEDKSDKHHIIDKNFRNNHNKNIKKT